MAESHQQYLKKVEILQKFCPRVLKKGGIFLFVDMKPFGNL